MMMNSMHTTVPPQKFPDWYDGNRSMEVLDAYNTGSGTSQPADKFVAQSVLPASTGASRDFSYIAPEQAEAEHQKLLGFQEEMLQACELPYRVIDTAAGDLGSSAARKYDAEAWVPTQGNYRELTSTSNCTTYQARRLNVRYRTADGKTATAATLNGTLATTRWLVAILENHQQADGSVKIPTALRPYLGGEEFITPKSK
jgi:seryl-tRNA synthetase